MTALAVAGAIGDQGRGAGDGVVDRRRPHALDFVQAGAHVLEAPR